MLENLTLVAVVIIVLWLVVLVSYLLTSRQQIDLHQDLQELEQQMDKLEKKG